MDASSGLGVHGGVFDLVVDAGNTQIKLAVFSGSLLLWRGVLPSVEEGSARVPFPYCDGIGRVIVSSVSDVLASSLRVLAPNARWHWLTSASLYPFANQYATPHSLGSDRLAAVAGAYFEVGGSCIVVDAGSALTCDVLHEGLGYLGGTISPGIRMRLGALHEYTARLPHVLWGGEEVPHLGCDTASCMLSGCVLGIVGEIDNFALRIRGLYPEVLFRVVVTGGDAAAISLAWEGDHLVCPDLVLLGLRGLLEMQ